MKKFILTAVFAVTVMACVAQSKFGLFGGPQITSARYTVNGKKQSNTSKYGFQLGGQFKIPFENKLYFSPAAFYSLKGYNVTLSQPSILPDSLATDNNTSIHTFELAALLQYDFTDQPGHFFVKLGPSLDFQVLGKEKFNKKTGGQVERDMVFSFTSYGRVAASFLFQLGYETKEGLILTAHYTHGMGSMNNADFGPGIWHRALGFTIGKYLVKKK